MVPKSNPRNHLSGSAIAGIVIVTVVSLIALIASAFFLHRRRRMSQSHSNIQLLTINNPTQNHESIQSFAIQTPNPAIYHLSDNDTERMYLEKAENLGDRTATTPNSLGSFGNGMASRGKQYELTGEIASPLSADIALKGRFQGLKPADERRSVPYKPEDFL